MKELVRAHGDYEKQLRLAHDFRTAVSGNPRIIRDQLRHYHLLEMPEEWNQLSFDDHVHDVNTKGRKSSSHLIMDAWIKGIRRLRVVYYNFLEPRFAVELLEAAEIMGIDIRIGTEFCARFRNRFVQLIWVPRGFADSQDFLCFLVEDPVVAFMAEGKKVSDFQKRYVLDVLEAFNIRHRHDIEERWGIELLGRAIARALLSDEFRNPRTDLPIAIGIGGGHYAPRFTDRAMRGKFAFGHMIPDYIIKDSNDLHELLRLAKDSTPGVTHAFIHRSAKNKHSLADIGAILEELDLLPANREAIDVI